MSKIKDLKEKERLTVRLMVKGCTKGITSKGSPYLNLSLQDDTGTIEGKFWDVKPEEEAQIKIGHVQEIVCEVLEYNHSLQLRVTKIEDIPQEGLDLSQYVLSSTISEAESSARIEGYLKSFTNENYRILVTGMLQKAGERFYQYPAASKIHHGYLGGLAEHTLGMAAVAEDICGLYPQLDRDLLIAGVLTHDIGKVAELGGVIQSEYTEEGKLTGHISIGHAWLVEVADAAGLGSSEEAILLRHLVLSHHGKLEYGSPMMPEVPEAEVLSLIDNLDARLNTLKSALDGVKPGQWTQRIFALENRQFYKPKH